MKKLFRPFIPVLALAALTITSCKKDDDTVEEPSTPDNSVETPGSYSFDREGASSVSYSGQTDRLNQLAEMKSIFGQGDAGNLIDQAQLADMFANTNDDGNGHFSFSSSKQLKNKTFDLDVAYFESVLADAATASVAGNNGVTASNGTAGLVVRGSKQTTILVNENGHEFTQLFEKGLMGATFLYQICNTYLTDDKIGPQINNTDLEDGKNYTAKEHHMDEAFGYYGAAPDFSSTNDGSESPRYWAKYSNTVNPHTGSTDILMNAYKKARAAIVAKNNDVLDNQVAIIQKELEKVAAATAIHYLNESLSKTDDGDRLHVLSEAYAFVMAIRYTNPDFRKMHPNDVQDILDSDIGMNFWEVTSTGLNNAKDKLADTYGLNDVKDLL